MFESRLLREQEVCLETVGGARMGSGHEIKQYWGNCRVQKIAWLMKASRKM